MENVLEVNTVSHRDAEAESQSESSTLSNSLKSSLTVENSRGDADSKKLKSEGSGWTNEKHNLYLDSLENSFVRQLYSLLGGGGGGTQTLNNRTTRVVQSNSHKFTDQFTVLQNGYRHKVSFGKKRAMMGTAVQGNLLLCNEEIKISGDKLFTRTNSLAHAQNTAEASGQNFREEEVEGKGCNSGKRRRGANYDDNSLNDQVVP